MGSIVPFQDLNLPPESRNSLISPKIEPKLEPFDEEHNNPYYTSTTTNQSLNPPNNSNSSPAPLEELIFPTITTNSQQTDVYSEFYRISELFRTAFAKKMQSYGDVEVSTTPDSSRAIVAHHHVEEDTRVSTHVVSKAKSNQRSSEMVRVSALGIEDQRYFRDLVRRTRMLYESLRIFSVREEESGRLVGLGKRMRGDLRAASLLKEQGLWLHRDKRIIGSIPGVYVGDFFFFRMELCAVGLHGQCQAGIDYVPASQSANGEPVATSIIVSGGYEDDEDGGDVIIYTGHGGQLRHSVRQCVHQKLDGGNLALERSMFYGIEIRVIRGIKHEGSPSNKIYVYDGLYRVVDSWFDIGKSGFGVYKYKLVRMPDQPVMGSTFFKFAADVRKSPLTARPTGYLSLDISNGKENWPVLLYNDIDSDQGPMFYEYLAKSVYPPFAFGQMSNNSTGCDCIGGCTEGNCYCAQRNGNEFAYDRNGILVRGKPVIFECGKFCSCPPTCQNRVSQKGVKHRLEVFRSRETGWGVRPLDMIPAGSFICEYTGVVLTRQQSVVLSMNGDSLIYPNRFPEKWAEWGDLSQVFSEFVRPLYPSIPPLEFAMDVSRMRNVACYFSQSSSPNVVVQYVLYDHYNVMYPHIMLFAVENIPPLRELSLDYGVADSDEWEGKLAICN